MSRFLKKYRQLLNDINNQLLAPVYFLYGEEPYFIDRIAEAIQENALGDGEQEFNQTVVYGLETDPRTLINTAKQVPMMAERQVVVVKEAQKLKKYKELVSYVEQPPEHTTLIFLYKRKKYNLPKEFVTAVRNNGVFFRVKRVYQNQLPRWITDHVKNQGYTIDQKASVLLAEHLGSDLSKVTNELDKILLQLSEGDKIGLEMIEENVGISRQFNIFEFQDALGERDQAKVYRIMDYFAANSKDHPMVVTLGSLYKFFSNVYKLHFLPKKASQKEIQKELGLPFQFFVKKYKQAASNYTVDQLEQIIHLLHTYDLRVKGVNNVSNSEGELLRELTYKILH